MSYKQTLLNKLKKNKGQYLPYFLHYCKEEKKLNSFLVITIPALWGTSSNIGGKIGKSDKITKG